MAKARCFYSIADKNSYMQKRYGRIVVTERGDIVDGFNLLCNLPELGERIVSPSYYIPLKEYRITLTQIESEVKENDALKAMKKDENKASDIDVSAVIKKSIPTLLALMEDRKKNILSKNIPFRYIKINRNELPDKKTWKQLSQIAVRNNPFKTVGQVKKVQIHDDCMLFHF